ncbi:MAG: hypothetical protein HY903_10475 [Deltaproteobacteria bacterium]|nr:hypothetical protein [Deltaproteobacteria bacterium]
MSKEAPQLLPEAARDIAAAKAELRGRRDELTAEYDERLSQLANVEAALAKGELSPRVAQDRVRQLLRDGRASTRLTRAGRTQIGMRPPASAPGPGAAPGGAGASRLIVTPSLIAAAVTKTQTEVDTRVVGVLVAHPVRREEARLELALLAHLRRGLELVLADLPKDAVLLEGILEFADEAQGIIADLTEGGVPRVRRLVEYERELTGQLLAAGATLADLKAELRRARKALDVATPDLKRAADDAVTIFARLAVESERRLPVKVKTLFDDLLRQDLPSRR